MRAGHTAYTPLLGIRVQQSYEPQKDRYVDGPLPRGWPWSWQCDKKKRICVVLVVMNTEHSVQSEQR
jgi:hypothetical protein